MRRLAPLSVLLLTAIAGGCHKQAGPAPQAEDVAPQPQPAATQAATDTSNAGKGLPTAEITDPTGAPAKLSDLKGKPVLVNLWATWCVPCVKELPTLDALAAREAGKLQVVVVNEDLEGPRAVQPFLKRRPLKTLKTWMDTSNALMIPLKTASLPTTILYDANGKEVWRVSRDLDWTGAQAKALLAQAGA
ncbi:TlpA family protein disulfide reductase [uncultured Sphingomonas sp.]|uniref:TlpA family protein disulfide reductase n=1 Tax=uncultured Sphingomonas sp. TaxID=158754 RepID=UPI0025F9D628|nr:TlpA family protein disulfide reductase [uncultured Sphingomonas sp.]